MKKNSLKPKKKFIFEVRFSETKIYISKVNQTKVDVGEILKLVGLKCSLEYDSY